MQPLVYVSEYARPRGHEGRVVVRLETISLGGLRARAEDTNHRRGEVASWRVRPSG